MTMGMYTKRPVTIEARQWDGTADGADEVIRWVREQGGKARLTCDAPVCTPDVPHTIAIDTLEGTMRGGPQWWIIRGVKGEFYPCKPDVFEQTYSTAIDPDLGIRATLAALLAQHQALGTLEDATSVVACSCGLEFDDEARERFEAVDHNSPDLAWHRLHVAGELLVAGWVPVGPDAVPVHDADSIEIRDNRFDATEWHAAGGGDPFNPVALCGATAAAEGGAMNVHLFPTEVTCTACRARLLELDGQSDA